MARMARISLVVCVLVSVLLIGGGAFTASADDGRRIVTFQNLDLNTKLGYDIAVSVVRASGSTLVGNSEVHKLWIGNALLIELNPGNIAGALDYLVKSLLVLDVSEDPFGCENPLGCVERITPSLVYQVEREDWGIERIRIPEVRRNWPELGGERVQVAVLDTGIAPHPDLKIGHGYNALLEGGLDKTVDYNGHGTHVAGIIGATVNGEGTKGAAPKATIVPVKVLDHNGFGYLSDFLRGLQFVYGRTDIRLANMSFGFKDNYPSLREAIKRLRERGVIMVAAAGSCGAADEGGGDGDPQDLCDVPQTGISYPAAHPGVIAVGATNAYNHMTAYSQIGKELALVAPGGSHKTGIRILSTYLDRGYGYSSGTSQAAAHVTGLCALALQIDPNILFGELRESLRTVPLYDSFGRPYPEDRQGDGLIDALETVKALQ